MGSVVWILERHCIPFCTKSSISSNRWANKVKEKFKKKKKGTLKKLPSRLSSSCRNQSVAVKGRKFSHITSQNDNPIASIWRNYYHLNSNKFSFFIFTVNKSTTICFLDWWEALIKESTTINLQAKKLKIQRKKMQ